MKPRFRCQTHSPARQAGRGLTSDSPFARLAHKTRSPAGQAGRGRDLLSCRGNNAWSFAAFVTFDIAICYKVR